jgi:hypothetical protein
MTSAAEDLRFKIYDLSKGAQEITAKTALLLRRLLQGEEAHPELFDCIFECAKFLSESGSQLPAGISLNDDEMQTLESLVVARMLHALGYIGDVSGLGEEVKSVEISVGLLESLCDKKPLLNNHINKALKESML